MTKLYQLPEAFAELEAMTEDGELTEEAFAKLTNLQMALEAKLDGCCRVMRHFEAQADAFKTEADRLTRHANSARKSADWLKAYMQDNLSLMGIDKIETAMFKLRMQKNPPACVIDADLDVWKLPGGFQTVKTEPNRKAMIEHWRNNGTLPTGVEVVQTKSLRIS